MRRAESNKPTTFLLSGDCDLSGAWRTKSIRPGRFQVRVAPLYSGGNRRLETLGPLLAIFRFSSFNSFV